MAKPLSAHLSNTFFTAVTAALLFSSIAAAQTVEELTNPAPGDWPTFGRSDRRKE